MLSETDKEVLKNRDFQKLVRVRRWVTASFMLLLLGLYLVFSLLSIYAPDVLAARVISTSPVPAGIALGYAILALIFVLTLVYVWLANNFFEPLEKDIRQAVADRKDR
jgi:uncharacterized membrane protein (DUF485 family)